MKIHQGIALFPFGILIVLAALSVSFIMFVYPYEFMPEWVGIKKDTEKSVTVKVLKKCKQVDLDRLQNELDLSTFSCENTTSKNSKDRSLESTDLENFEISVVSREQSPKTFWDLLNLFSVLGIPLAVYLFQIGAQEKAENDLCEAALQQYIDRISDALVDTQRKAQIFSPNPGNCNELDVIRVRTITTLRRVESNTERYHRVFEFLRDTELLTILFKKAKALKNIHFSNLDLSDIDFSDAVLQKLNFSGAILENATFINADLKSANFYKTNLQSTDFTQAILKGSDLSWADLSGAKLIKADLEGAKLLHVRGLEVLYQLVLAHNWDKAEYDKSFKESPDFIRALEDLRKEQEKQKQNLGN
jgi:uncharacterized protein YjbI with pentapeptide repeats